MQLITPALGLHDISHAIFNAHLVSKSGPVISGNFHHMHDFTKSSIYYTEPFCRALLLTWKASYLLTSMCVHCVPLNRENKGANLIRPGNSG